MHVENGEWILSEGELEALAARLAPTRGPLCVLPAGAEGTPGTWEAFQALDAEARALLGHALGVLASPGKVVRLHEVQGGEHVSRATLAWGGEGAWITLARAGGIRRVSLRSEGELRLHLLTLLAADDSIRGNRLGATLSTPALLALLAAVDHLRRLRLVALLNHEEPSDLFNAEDVARRLRASDVEDFRWILPFLEKLLPLPVKDLAVAADPLPALAELVQGGLLVPFDGAVPPTVFELSDAGRFLAEACFHEASRAALAVTALDEAGGAAHDVLLLVRSPFDLILLTFSGSDAGLTTLQGGDLDLALQLALAPPEARLLHPPSQEASPATLRRLPLHLDVESGVSGGKHLVLLEDGVLGRVPECDLVLTDVGISRRHAAFTWVEGAGWTVQDLGSSNGTYVNSQRIEGPRPLKPGDRVQICAVLMRVAQG